MTTPKIRLAQNSGFCFGVKRAIQLAFDAGKDFPSLVTLGPIIHNPQMVERLAKEGITSIKTLNEAETKPVIIRSHGVEKEVLKTLKENNQIIIDATCPFVAKAQDYAKKLSEAGYPVIICGNPDHPEVIAIKSYVDGEVYVVSKPEDLENRYFEKLGIISQTTQKIENFKAIVNSCIEIAKEVRVINTICSATSVRQNSTKNLAKESDIMVVIGGKNSSNTKQLASIASNFTQTYHIETAAEIIDSMIAGKQRIGLTAGASTPDWIILNVFNKIKKSIGDITVNITNVEDIPGYKEEQNG